jgi:hypothetical protein
MPKEINNLYKQVVDKIKKAQPTKEWKGYHNYPIHDIYACPVCKTGIGSEEYDINPNLEDVLLAIKPEYGEYICKINNYYLSIFAKTSEINWLLGKPLSEQSEEVWELINKLI